MIYGRTGIGKSEAGLAIGERVAQYISEIKGGTPEEYFCADNIAVMTMEEVLRVLSSKMDKKFSIVGFDDIGIAWSSRDFMTQTNQYLNDIAQTIRTRNLFCYFTLPDPSLIDKVPRELIRYLAKIESSHFRYGYVEAKIQEPQKTIQFSKKRYPYLLDQDGQRIVRHMIFRPSKALRDDYEKRRSEIEKLNTNQIIGNMQQISIEESAPVEPRLSKKSLFSTPMKIDYNNGEGLSMSKIADKYGVSTQTVYEALHYQEPKLEPKKVA